MKMIKCLCNRLSIIPTFVIVILIFSCASKDGNSDCGQFKNGKFILHLRGQYGDVFFSINRQDSIQIETDKKAGYYSKLLVRWTGACNYEATLLETTFPFPDSIQKIRKLIPLKTEIIAMTNDYYIFKSHRDNYPTMTDTMWVEK